MTKQPLMLLTCDNVIDGKFNHKYGWVIFTVELHVAFILRHGDVVAIQESDKKLWKLEEFYLNEDNTVSISASGVS